MNWKYALKSAGAGKHATTMPEPLKMLDCFCGMGGVSDGFALEGFDVTGIDIVDAPKMLGYKHKFIQANMMTLKGEDFKGFDVVWGSPPCRDFSELCRVVGHTWKRPPQPEIGLQLVNAYLKFVEEAKPTFWIMENVPGLRKHLNLKARQVSLIGKTMKRAFWGNYPTFLIPGSTKGTLMGHRDPDPNKRGHSEFKQTHVRVNGKIPKHEQHWRAKIPLPCSQAFAKACREALQQ